MKRLHIILLIIISAFIFSACCGMPKRSLSTVGNEGTLKFTISPDNADIYVDGTLVGKASNYDGRKQVMSLTGRHTIEIKAEGYHSYSLEVVVGAGAQSDFNATLSKK